MGTSVKWILGRELFIRRLWITLCRNSLGEDAVVRASGPGAHLATCALEQSVIIQIMNYAGSLTSRAKAALAIKRR